MYDNEYYKQMDIIKQPGMATGKAVLEAVRIISAYEGEPEEEIEIRYKLHSCAHYLESKTETPNETHVPKKRREHP